MFDHGEKRRSERDLPAQAMVVPSTIPSLKCIPITHAPPDEESLAFEGAQRHSRVYQSGDSEKPSKQVDPRHGAPLIRFGQPVCNWRGLKPDLVILCDIVAMFRLLPQHVFFVAAITTQIV